MNALATLRLFQRTTRLLFVKDPGIDPPEFTSYSTPIITRPADLEANLDEIVDLAESILVSESQPPPTSTLSIPSLNPSVFIPTPATTQPLFVAVHASCNPDLRSRAIQLLEQYPRREGLWDSLLAARLAELLLAREDEALQRTRSNMGDKPDRSTLVLIKVHDMRVHFKGERNAEVRFRSWQEWMAGRDGVDVTLRW
jgi:hypothetical protein